MRKNLPITDRERTFAPDQKLISSTDLKGKIRHCNQAFVDISGFTREELIGQPHNIVRHPDMPSAAYETMWSYLKARRPWMGLVKNRCKNGDFYWVSAYITPITDKGEIIGYESVRSCPDRKDVERVARLYKRLQAGGTPMGRWHSLPYHHVLLPVVILAGIAGYSAGQHALSLAVLVLGSIAYGAWGHLARKTELDSLKALTTGCFSDDLAARSFTDDNLMLGRIKVAILSQQARLDTVLTRIEDSARLVTSRSGEGLTLAREAQAALIEQQRETERVAAAVHELSTTIGEVSANVQVTADRAEESRSLSISGKQVVASTRQAIENLKNTVYEISQAVGDLARQTQGIAAAAQIIEQIADQTNLLALNAAIEAARAGEHGRGFAVVADEVRSLAKRTRDSTQEIHAVVNSLVTKSEQSVNIAEQGTRAADTGLTKMLEAESTLSNIADAVNNIAEMALQMAAAVEEQAQVSDQINEQVERISGLAQNNLEKGGQSTNAVEAVEAIAKDLHELVVRFKQS
ncbi:MAG: methyl-accepting chemotaxis protein [Pseudomonadota bacterium]